MCAAAASASTAAENGTPMAAWTSKHDKDVKFNEEKFDLGFLGWATAVG